MIDQSKLNFQLPDELKLAFCELEIFKHLRNANIKRNLGFTCSYLFQLVFCLIFQHKNWFRLLESIKADQFPAKDTVYRFLNYSKFAWRRFLLSFSASAISKVDQLTDSKRVKVFIIDDSMFERNRSKKVELLARCMDHSTIYKRFYKGFRMLTLGWSDGYSFMPVDFSLLSSIKAQINGISEKVDKRTSGYKRRVDALQTAPEQVPVMLKQALEAGIEANYVLMDTWFTHTPLINKIADLGLDVIGMVKTSNQRFLIEDKELSLKELFRVTQPTQQKSDILSSIHTVLKNEFLLKWSSFETAIRKVNG